MKNNELFARTITGIIGGFVFFGTYFSSQEFFGVLLVCIYLYATVIEWRALMPTMRHFFLTLPLYPTLPIASLFALNYWYHDTNILLPLAPFIIAWSHDTCAYFVGKTFGKHKLAPVISPKKTWEGLLGGWLGIECAIYFLHGASSALSLIVTSALYTALACSGDIFISYLKRKQNMKDSGELLPGHGGILDRFDSVFFVAPIYFLVTLLSGI